ncbi:MAG: single-strand DNA-binding protein [Pseudomonadota bacterium]|nr:single-strand DNA-binding protein [Pseudomonadota bacterium]
MKRLTITGNVGHDAVTRVDKAGESFVTFSVGVSVGNKQAPKTDWVDVNCNGKLAEIAQSYVKKGTKVLIEGYPTTNAYINRSGEALSSLKLFANHLELLSKQDTEDECSDEK